MQNVQRMQPPAGTTAHHGSKVPHQCVVLAAGGAGLVSAMGLLLDDRPASRIAQRWSGHGHCGNWCLILQLCSKAEAHVVCVVPHALWLSERAQPLSRASTAPRVLRLSRQVASIVNRPKTTSHTGLSKLAAWQALRLQRNEPVRATHECRVLSGR